MRANSDEEEDKNDAYLGAGEEQEQFVEEDDDDDVIFTKFGGQIQQNAKSKTKSSQKESQRNQQLMMVCKLCNRKLVAANDTRKKTAKSQSNQDNVDTLSSPSLDLILFNYAREIYTYEFNSVKSKTPNPNPGSDASHQTRNMIDKKAYKTFVSTCFDINHTASIANTLVYQTKVPISFTSIQNANLLNPQLNLAPSYLSLIVAAGFNKGELHVFDVFKKDASIFFNNTKLIDKTKVTCIK